jgi:hypothetical protein
MERIAVHHENRMTHINTLCGKNYFFNVKAGGIYADHSGFKGLSWALI